VPLLRSLKPNLTRDEALARFRGPWTRLFGALGGSPLRSVADAYVPFRMYEVSIESDAGRRTALFALDAVEGSLDPFEFQAPPSAAELVEIETRNRPEAVVDAARGAKLLEDKLRRLIYQTGFFRVRGLRFQTTPLPSELHVPYWIGLYGGERVGRLRVIDAVRRRFEGGKARALFESWLAS
jgi:hypothetical protein